MNNDLISRSALLKAFSESNHIKETASGLDVMEMLAIKEIIDNAPTVTVDNYSMGYQDGVRKVLSEKPKGEWIEGENGNIKCNQCESEIRYSYLIGNKPDFPKFCPNCGADMRTKENDK